MGTLPKEWKGKKSSGIEIEDQIFPVILTSEGKFYFVVLPTNYKDIDVTKFNDISTTNNKDTTQSTESEKKVNGKINNSNNYVKKEYELIFDSSQFISNKGTNYYTKSKTTIPGLMPFRIATEYSSIGSTLESYIQWAKNRAGSNYMKSMKNKNGGKKNKNHKIKNP